MGALPPSRPEGHIIDFWPGTGLWIVQGSTQRHRGVRKLIEFCKPQQHPNGRP